jgi:hypothetical protein
LIFAVVTAFFLILAAVTAFFFSCLAPTLFLPSWLAAKADAPPTAMNREGQCRDDVRVGQMHVWLHEMLP